MSVSLASTALSLQLTRTTAAFVTGFVLYNLWKKLKNEYPNVIIKSLHIYPVKSCKGIEVNNWPISKYGLKYDREWMIYNPNTKRFVSQRQIHKLALIKVDLIIDNNKNKNDDKIVNGIKLSAPNMESITVTIEKNECIKNTISNIILWKDKVCGIDQGNNISNWLSKFINNGKKYRLLRILSNNYKRNTNPKYTPNHLQKQSNVTYADGYPYLIISESSLNKLNYYLNKRGYNKILMKRFRPNIVIKTDLNKPFIEDIIKKLILIPKKYRFNINKKKEIINELEKNKLNINNELITFYITHPCP
eukprot:106669_1